MRKYFSGKIRLVFAIGICMLFIIGVFPITSANDTPEGQTKVNQEPTISSTPIAKVLSAFKFFNWNFWDNPPHIFSRNLGNVGIGGIPPSDAKLYVKTNNISTNYTIYAEGGLGIKSVSTILEGTGITGEGGHAGVCGNGYIGLLGFGYFGGWFEGKGFFSGDVSIGTSNSSSILDVNGDVKTSGDYKYTSAKTYYLNIPAAAFNSAAESYYQYINYGSHILTTYPADISLICPVYLPQGATVKELQSYVFDIDSTYDIELATVLLNKSIYLRDSYTMTAQWLNTSGSSTDMRVGTDTTIEYATIDNQLYQYRIGVYYDANSLSNTNLGFYGCRITYTMDTIAP